MIFPIQWHEPFGLVMTEAMACGTPVIARPLGAALELVRDGETGFLCDTVDEMVQRVPEVDMLSPRACRAHVSSRFSGEAMVDGYERLFSGLVG